VVLSWLACRRQPALPHHSGWLSTPENPSITRAPLYEALSRGSQCSPFRTSPHLSPADGSPALGLPPGASHPTAQTVRDACRERGRASSTHPELTASHMALQSVSSLETCDLVSQRQKRTFTPRAMMHKRTTHPTVRPGRNRRLLCSQRREELLIIAHRTAALCGHQLRTAEDTGTRSGPLCAPQSRSDLSLGSTYRRPIASYDSECSCRARPAESCGNRPNSMSGHGAWRAILLRCDRIASKISRKPFSKFSRRST
jgi:hypothetical protein